MLPWLIFPNWRASFEGADRSAKSAGRSPSRAVAAHLSRDARLIGDASGSVDAITGEGMGLAFDRPLALADALAADNLDQYQTAHRRLARRPAFMAQLMLTLDRFPRLRPLVLRTFRNQARDLRAPVGRSRRRMNRSCAKP
jgi:flavin-dependent dehydrogenase